MKTNIYIALALAFAVFSVTETYAGKKKERKLLFGSAYNYEISSEGVGHEGTKIVKVWGEGKKVDKAIAQAKKNAIAAVIFCGIPAGGGSNHTPPLCTDPESEKIYADYFFDFFETDGRYLQFINLTTDGIPSGQDRLRLKKGYKVAINVQLMYGNLRRQLEDDGIIKKLSDGF